jgi:hypothetical protein
VSISYSVGDGGHGVGGAGALVSSRVARDIFKTLPASCVERVSELALIRNFGRLEVFPGLPAIGALSEFRKHLVAAELETLTVPAVTRLR